MPVIPVLDFVSTGEFVFFEADVGDTLRSELLD